MTLNVCSLSRLGKLIISPGLGSLNGDFLLISIIRVMASARPTLLNYYLLTYLLNSKVYSAFHPSGSVNEYQLRLGRQRQVWLIPIADERVGVQVKLWNPLRTRAILEPFCGGDSYVDALYQMFAPLPFTFYLLTYLFTYAIPRHIAHVKLNNEPTA